MLCLELLKAHLCLAAVVGATAAVLGNHARPLRQLLFRLLDAANSVEIQQVSGELQIVPWIACLRSGVGTGLQSCDRQFGSSRGHRGYTLIKYINGGCT